MSLGSLFPGVEVVVIRSARRTRTISIQVKPGLLTVRAPRGVSENAVGQVLEQRREWITQTLANVEKQETAAEQWATRPLLLFGAPLSLQYQPDAQEKWHVQRVEDQLHVSGPADSTSDPMLLHTVKEWYIQLAKTYMVNRLAELAKELGYKFSQVRIKEQKTRWGSCSAKGNINLNWRLMQTPKSVIDYVLVHELCHLREMNHSQRFWRLVEQAYPDFQAARQWLQRNGKYLPL